jgi:hypothetical protein
MPQPVAARVRQGDCSLGIDCIAPPWPQAHVQLAVGTDDLPDEIPEPAARPHVDGAHGAADLARVDVIYQVGCQLGRQR